MINPAEYCINIGARDKLQTKPPKVEVGPGDKVTWINKWTQPVEVMFYMGDLVFINFPPGHKFTLDAFGGSNADITFEVKSEPLEREYTYQVYCSVSRGFAEGESDPKINVRL
jgi:plastocyanin